MIIPKLAIILRKEMAFEAPVEAESGQQDWEEALPGTWRERH